MANKKTKIKRKNIYSLWLKSTQWENYIYILVLGYCKPMKNHYAVSFFYTTQFNCKQHHCKPQNRQFFYNFISSGRRLQEDSFLCPCIACKS